MSDFYQPVGSDVLLTPAQAADYSPDQVVPTTYTDEEIANTFNSCQAISGAMADNGWPSDANIANLIRAGRLLYFPDGYKDA